MNYLISEIDPQKQTELLPWPLLLDADPDRKLVAGYLLCSRILIAWEQVSENDDSLPQSAESVIGVTVFEERTAEFEILNVAVKTGWQNQGIGGQLLDRCLELTTIRDSGKPVLIKTGDLTSPALALYQKKGFRQIALVEDYFVEHYPEPIYENGIRLRNQVILQRDGFTEASLD